MQPKAPPEFQLRQDLVFARYAIGLENQTVVKDPLNLEFYFFNAFESGLLRHLKRSKTVAQLKREVDDELRPGQIGARELQLFLAQLIRDNLVVSDQLGAGKKMAPSNRSLGLVDFTRVSSLLAIRFRGLNPVSIFEFMTPFTRFLFQPAFLLLALILYLVALIFLALNVGELWDSSYVLQKFSQPDVVVPLAIAMVVVKILHEFGHGLACHAIGRKCHELGAMLLAFMPCLYCNVSDVWMEPSRWKRILVSMAGIYVELIIASICVPLWLYSVPGEFQFFCFSLFLVCSVNTLFVNGNPLLRYDGYFALSDLLEIPNLYDAAQKNLNSFWSNIFFSRSKGREPISAMLCMYAISASIYRKFILGAILFMVYSFFDNAGLPRVGILICMVFAAAAILAGAMKMFRSFLSGLANIRYLYWFRAIGVAAALGLLFYFVAWIPVSLKAHGTGQIVYSNQGIIYSPSRGQIQWQRQQNDEIEKGQTVAVVYDENIEINLIKAKNDLEATRHALKNQEVLSNQGVDNLPNIELLKQSVRQQEDILERLEAQKLDLTIQSPATGTLVPLPKKQVDNPYQTESTSRVSCCLFAENAGATVARGEPIGLIANPESLAFEVLIPESSIGTVKVGQSAVVYCEQATNDYLDGIVENIGIHRLDAEGEIHPANSNVREMESFIRVTIHAEPGQTFVPRFQAPLKAMIIGETRPLYQAIWKYLRDNFDT